MSTNSSIFLLLLSIPWFHLHLPPPSRSSPQPQTTPTPLTDTDSSKHTHTLLVILATLSLLFSPSCHCQAYARPHQKPAMASSLATTSSLASKSAADFPLHHHSRCSSVVFRLSPKPKLRFLAKGLRPGLNSPTMVKAQLDEETKDAKPSNDPSPPSLATKESLSEFFTQVSSLVKLVDSRDIVEFQLKQFDCEVLIRKKEALPQPPTLAPIVMMHSPPPTLAAAPASSATASSPEPSTPPPSPSPPASKSPKTSFPPLKSPMSGTFYRSSGPGEPPFVKVGDKVQKGQVICIIEAMKLMNEIEADQTGTIIEILAEDAKPVSIDAPLFVIQP